MMNECFGMFIFNRYDKIQGVALNFNKQTYEFVMDSIEEYITFKLHLSSTVKIC